MLLINNPVPGSKTPSTPNAKKGRSGDLKAELEKLVLVDGGWILPLIQGGKGVGATNGRNAGAWAKENAGGTIAAIGAAIGYGENGREVSYTYTARTRPERHEEMIALSIEGCILQAKTAHKASHGRGRVRINFLKMAGGSMRIMRGVLAGTRLAGGGNMIHAVTMGAGLPSEDDALICADEGVYIDPIISSSMALKVLLKRSFKAWKGRYAELIGAVVYEDPWLAGGHNGITSREDPELPKDPYDRVRDLRNIMNENGMEKVAIIMAGGVWYLRDWESWLNNSEIGPIAFQIGTRDLLTQECPIVDEWKHLILSMKEGDVVLNKFSPTGFYSSAYKNAMIRKMYQRSEKQVPYGVQGDGEKTERINGKGIPARGYFVSPKDKAKIDAWRGDGFKNALRTPDETLIFVTGETLREIKLTKAECVGCLSTCKLATWSENPEIKFTTGKLPDPRVHCIRKGLLGAIQGDDLDNQLIFAGHNAYKAGKDPFYRDKTGGIFIPTVKQLVERLMIGD
ncbi:Dioxygenases related to 2-nitropropane dioxygenase [hydrothermal vent metagenome]|uniref:Dioxygenases related to 2-nitropropane dioxygenase n=1 Tax=hydrothermal vent metagenome TaxID=652676 RepID=A0A3B0T2V6_9ZZZZ